MKIKRIEIVGFKSFVEKVVLDIPAGVTGIVGPNGCGKSNIVDAIRWAMGEQSAKNLRGRSMEEVIFGGSESRKPHGMAEVSITFDNSDGLAPAAYRECSEIMVTRRLFRNGDSDYLLNKTSCRLLDIAELFLDTGVGKRAYSIIEQGKIGMIINAKPEERRYLIEEAAGVSRFKARKQTAQRKIDATKVNLTRLSDIISEVRRQLGGLKRQAQRAERYRQLREELKLHETQAALHRYHELNRLVRHSAVVEQKRQTQHSAISVSLQQAELQLDELRLRQTEGDKELGQVQQQVFTLSAAIQEAEGQIAFSVREQENLSRQKERLIQEESEAATRLEQTRRQQTESEQTLMELTDELLMAREGLQETEERLGELLAGETQQIELLDGLRSQLLRAAGKMTEQQGVFDDQQRRIKLCDERLQRNHQEVVEVRDLMERQTGANDLLLTTLKTVEARDGELRQRQDLLRETIAIRQRDKERIEVEALERREDLSRSRSRLESLQQLERNLEGYGQGVRSILQHPDWKGRFDRMVADVLDVPGDLEVAVEALLGDRLQMLLADNVEEVRAAVAHLASTGGRCSFLLSQESQIPIDYPAGEPLFPLVGCRDSRIAGLFDGVFLVESLGVAGVPLPVGATLVTREGEVRSHRGEWSGGSAVQFGDGLLHQKREIRELSVRVENSAKVVAELQQQRHDLQQTLQQGEEELRQLVAEQHRQALQLVDVRKDLVRSEQEIERLESRIETLSSEEGQLYAERERCEKLRDEAAAEIAVGESRKGSLQRELDHLQETYQVQRRNLEQVREELTVSKVRVAGLVERDDALRRNIDDLRKLAEELKGRKHLLRSRQQEADEEREKLVEKRSRHQAELEVLFAERQRVQVLYDKQRDRFEELGAGITELEAKVRQLRQTEAAAHQSLGTIQLEVRERELEIEHLCQAFQEKYRLDLAQLREPDPAYQVGHGERRVAELHRMLEGIGEVNLTAISEYEELEERYNFLAGQQDDLRRSLEGLQAAITKINRTTRKRFQEAFDAVNERFCEVFPRLFRGGQAELRLTDEADLLECGIDIVAQPPGKKLQNVGLLSGGEKALTAVALIFSIFLIKPSPFCLLDEVDAPLDDANIGRFNDLVQEMSLRSQFIVITHNQRTMKMADTLYGITMEEPGVSKMVSTRMTDYR